MAEGQSSDIADEAVLVFEAIAERSPGPTALPVISLVFDSGAVDIGEIVIWKIKIAEAVWWRDIAAGLLHGVDVGAAVVVFESGESVLPLAAGVVQFGAGEEVVLVRVGISVWRQYGAGR